MYSMFSCCVAGMFACFGYLSLYLCGKLHCFRPAGKSQAWRLCFVLTPLVVATLVGLTRIQDFRHHWEGKITWHTLLAWNVIHSDQRCPLSFTDVLVGGTIGKISKIVNDYLSKQCVCVLYVRVCVCDTNHASLPHRTTDGFAVLSSLLP